MTARREISGGVLSPGGAPAPARGGHQRNFGISFERISQRPAARPDVEPHRPSFERGKVLQALIDVGAVASSIAFIVITAAAFAVAFCIVFFVRLT